MASALAKRGSGIGVPALAAGLAMLVLAGCSTPGVDVAASGAGGLPAIAVQAPIGLPGDKTAHLGDQLIGALQRQGVTMAPTPDAPARYRLQGFCSAADGGSSTSVACVWDATTPGGERANRIVTEETVRGSVPADPWSVVSTGVLDRMAETVAGNVAAWLPSASAGSGISGILSPLAGWGFGADAPTAVALTGVSGAPGDGNRALASAMTSELRARNIPVTRANPNAYRLAAIVQLAPVEAGEQELTIDWTLTTADGAALGAVNQRNRVPAGALDTSWGATADTAAAAAAKGIIQLIPG